jgi:hypothetical protein
MKEAGTEVFCKRFLKRKMNNQPRILIIYTSTYSNPYLRINEFGIKKTWANFSNLYPQVVIKSIIGTENKNTLLFRFYAFLFELFRNRRFETILISS